MKARERCFYCWAEFYEEWDLTHCKNCGYSVDEEKAEYADMVVPVHPQLFDQLRRILDNGSKL